MLISIVKRLFSQNPVDNVPHRIYGTVVAQARNSVFFTRYSLPDTPMGRYNNLALHMYLLANRLKNASKSADAAELSQSVFDLFLIDLERGLRDIGFADTSVQKRKKRLVHTYYALIDEFDEALECKDTDLLVNAVQHRYFDKKPQADGKSTAGDLSRYMLRAANFLSSQSDEIIMHGQLDWPSADLAKNE